MSLALLLESAQRGQLRLLPNARNNNEQEQRSEATSN